MAINSNVFLFSKLEGVAFRVVHSTFKLLAYVVLLFLFNGKRYFEYYSYRMFMPCLSSFYFASFETDNKILRHFRVRKLHQKICAL